MHPVLVRLLGPRWVAIHKAGHVVTALEYGQAYRFATIRPGGAMDDRTLDQLDQLIRKEVGLWTR